MTIAPIVHTVETTASPARAFEIFTARMADWWPRGKTVGKNPHARLIIDPHVDGRWYEVDADGVEAQWGKVLAWEPPHRLLLGWQLGMDWTYDPAFLTEVEISFTETPSGGTRVTLEHRNLERFGDKAAERAASLNGGWPTRLADFLAYADAQN